MAILESIDFNSKYWTNWRSFFISMEGSAEFDFNSADNFKMVLGNIKDMDLKFNEVKVFKGESEVISEEQNYQNKLE